MSYLIDTNVISELLRSKPDATVLDCFANTPDEAPFLSVLTLGEIRKGVEKLADIQRREKLRVWLEHDLRDWFGPRILLAVTALHHDLRLVTRNTRDFACAGLEVTTRGNRLRDNHASRPIGITSKAKSLKSVSMRRIEHQRSTPA